MNIATSAVIVTGIFYSVAAMAQPASLTKKPLFTVKPRESVDKKSYDIAYKLAPVRFPHLKDITDRLNDSFKEQDSAKREELAKTPKGKCYLDAGVLQYTYETLRSSFTQESLASVLALNWAQSYDAASLQSFYDFYSLPSNQRILKDKGSPMEKLNGALALTANDALKDFDRESAKDQQEILKTFISQSKEYYGTTIMARFSREHKKELASCLEKAGETA